MVFLPLRPAKGSATESKFFGHLIKFYAMPSAVLAERVRNASYSFGDAILTDRNAEIAWFHFKCRNVYVKAGIVQHLGYLFNNDIYDDAPSSLVLWPMCDFYLHIRRESTEPNSDKKAVTLFCFGAPAAVGERFGKLLQKREAWLEVIEEPFLVSDVLFDQLHQVLAIWRGSFQMQFDRQRRQACSKPATMDTVAVGRISRNCTTLRSIATDIRSGFQKLDVHDRGCRGEHGDDRSDVGKAERAWTSSARGSSIQADRIPQTQFPLYTVTLENPRKAYLERHLTFLQHEQRTCESRQCSDEGRFPCNEVTRLSYHDLSSSDRCCQHLQHAVLRR